MHLFVPIPRKGCLLDLPTVHPYCGLPSFNTGWSEVSLCWPISVDSYLIQQSIPITIIYSL